MTDATRRGFLGGLGASLLLGPVAGTALYGWNPDALWIACGIVGCLSALAGLGLGRGASAGAPVFFSSDISPV